MEAIGLAGSVASIVDILAKSVNFLLNLQTKYKQADLTVSLLIGQLSTLKAALNQISDWITSSLVAVPQHEQLVSDLTISVEGCKVLVLALDDRIKSFDRNPDHTLNSRGKAQLLWEENGTTDYLNHLSNHINALNLLLTALQCRSLFEQRDLLQSDESRRIVNQIGDDKSSLLWLRDVNSNHSRTSISTENSQMLDTIFDFDREIFNSKAYQAAIRSNMRQALSNKEDTTAKRDGFPLDTLTDALDYVQLDDSEDVQTVREQSLSPFAILDGPIGDLRLGPLSSRDELTSESLGELKSSVSTATNISKDSSVDTQVVPAVTREPVNSLPYISLPLNNDVSDDDGEDSVPTSHDGEDVKKVSTKKMPRPRFSFLPKGFNFRISSASAALGRSREVDKQLSIENQRSAALERSREIDKQLSIENQGSHENILILGASQTGKSALLNSMKIFYNHDYVFDYDFRQGLKGVIFIRTVRGMRAILEGMEYSKGFLEHQKNEQHVQTILLHPAMMKWEPFSLDLALAIRALWSDSGVREHFKRWERRQWVTSCSYYFDSINRIALPDYVPTDQDILRIWVNTIGITYTLFTIENVTCRVFDVGGLRAERKKWIHIFEDVAVLIYLVDISEYDQCSHEDESISRTQESLTLFDSICNSKWFAHTSIVLFFTKIDCLKGKLATSPIKKYIPDFSNDPNSLQDVKDYFERRFLSLIESPQRTIDVYFTSLVSETGPGSTAFAAIEQALRLRKGKSGDKV